MRHIQWSITAFIGMNNCRYPFTYTYTHNYHKFILYRVVRKGLNWPKRTYGIRVITR